ncbi:hypothetical protein LHL20_19770 [Alteromonas sp. McT4-15]|uniref:hypothetical protein n=1 Tax=Alteromonas sp. McT4-15 TaxID=2881256 RepID=UPI001CF8D0D2|nr:hypothetical protein [Alteromonas sp. McT4-15]MCB4438474.1 hypothetical protein [Alteromonas sp. McT4-15]
MSVAEKRSWFTFEINVPVVLGFGVALYFMYSGHTATMENARKTSELLTKYETLLDSAIAKDADVLGTYKDNLKRVEDSLSPEEKRLLALLLDVKKE